jgi:hypothetical protein
METEHSLRLALGIISGRIGLKNLMTEDICDLGYDPYRFYDGAIDASDLKGRAESIIAECIMYGVKHDI